MVVGVWEFLTEPSAAVRGQHHRRQSRLMSAVLVFVVPTYLVMALAAAVSRTVAVTTTDFVLGGVLGLMSLVGYLLNRTEQYQRGAHLLTLTAIVGACFVSAREPDPVRAIYSAMIALTGPLYASFLLSARATLFSSLGCLALGVAVLIGNPAVPSSMAVIPIFFMAYVLALTVVSAALRQRQVKDLEGAAALLRSTLDASPDAAIIIDPLQRVTEWSLVAARLLGVSSVDALGKDLTTLARSPNESTFAASDQARRLEFDATRLEGSTFPCEGLLAPLPDGRSAVFLRDVSDRKQMEARLMMTDRLETMGRMVAGVAHELNNPLSYVTANLNYLSTRLAEEQLVPEDAKTVIDETRQGTRRIQTIVQDLRIFSRSGEFEAVNAVDIEAVLDSVLTLAQQRVKEARATVTRQFGNVGSVYGIESRLGQVFLNLIVNAAQALGDSERREIIVSTVREGDRVIIGVRDFGPGVPETIRPRLFTPFFTTKPAGQGTGLGLYISQNIISGLKGELRLSSPGQGALFEVVLPAYSGF